jgi:hypothetical protein
MQPHKPFDQIPTTLDEGLVEMLINVMSFAR